MSDDATPDHVCGCPQCSPTLSPTGPRQGEGHFAVRLGDVLVRVALDGMEITDCYEVEAGTPGRAWRYHTHRCGACGGTACAHIHRGNYSVAITRRPTGEAGGTTSTTPTTTTEQERQ